MRFGVKPSVLLETLLSGIRVGGGTVDMLTVDMLRPAVFARDCPGTVVLDLVPPHAKKRVPAAA